MKTHIEPTHLRSTGVTLNSRRVIRCDEDWHCRRMSCGACVQRRRNCFIHEGARQASYHGMYHHVVVSWPLQAHDHVWSKLLNQSSLLSKAASGRVGKYIRSLGIGAKARTPHVHYLVTREGAEVLYHFARQSGPPETLIFREGLNDGLQLVAVLGYFYDQNVVPTYNDPDRPKGIRILSGSAVCAMDFRSNGDLRGHHERMEKCWRIRYNEGGIVL
jgi:hypothetical protein